MWPPDGLLSAGYPPPLTRNREPDLGPLLFLHGLIFSVGLALLPILLSVLSCVVRIIITITS